MLFHSYACLPVKLIHTTHLHTHRVPPKCQWQSPSSSQQPPRRGGHQEDSRYIPTVRMSGQGFGWGRGERWGMGCGWILGLWCSYEKEWTEVSGWASVENTDLLQFLSPSRALSSVPSLEATTDLKGHKVSGTGWETEAYGLLRLLLRGGNEGKTITEEHLLFVGHHDKHSVGVKNLKYLWG